MSTSLVIVDEAHRLVAARAELVRSLYDRHSAPTILLMSTPAAGARSPVPVTSKLTWSELTGVGGPRRSPIIRTRVVQFTRDPAEADLLDRALQLVEELNDPMRSRSAGQAAASSRFAFQTFLARLASTLRSGGSKLSAQLVASETPEETDRETDVPGSPRLANQIETLVDELDLLPGDPKLSALLDLCSEPSELRGPLVIVSALHATAEYVASTLRSNDLTVELLSGSTPSEIFRRRGGGLLVVTDAVLAKIDRPDAATLVWFDPPLSVLQEERRDALVQLGGTLNRVVLLPSSEPLPLEAPWVRELEQGEAAD